MTRVILVPPTPDEWSEAMADWRVLPEYSGSAVSRAGEILVNGGSPEAMKEAINVVSNWRTAHGVPLNAIQNGLRDKAKRIDPECDTVQRLKRLTSIQAKLERMKQSRLRIRAMQDIGGCRAVLKTVDNARTLYSRYLESTRISHELWGTNDYVSEPVWTGYRGYHLKYKYVATKDHNRPYNGMRIEVQIRSHTQHVWATTVEIVGEMIGQNLKGGVGDPKWLRLFALVGSLFARIEGCPPVPGTPEDAVDLLTELSSLERELSALNFLKGCTEGMQALPEMPRHFRDGKHYFLMELDVERKRTMVTVFTVSQLRKAAERLKQRELDLSNEENRGNTNVVLVAADSVSSLHRAYPNYYLDTGVFIGLLDEILGTLP